MILYETSNQGLMLLSLIFYGFLSGIFFDVMGIISFLCNNNKIIRIIGDFIATCLCFIVAFLICQKLNFGEFRLYIPFVFFAFVGIERLTLGKLVAKTYNTCYNLLTKMSQAFSNHFRKKNNKNGTNNKKN